jgi:microcystin-dependent protein
MSGNPKLCGDIIEINGNQVKITGTTTFSPALPDLNVPAGTILDFAGAIVPSGYLRCDGTAYPTATYLVLFGVIGTTFGTGGAGTFRVPDCRSRSSVGSGQGSGLSNRILAATGGLESVSLTADQLAYHNHQFLCNQSTGGGTSAANSCIDQSLGIFNGALDNPTTLIDGVVGFTGAGNPHENMSPFIVLSKIIKT